MRPISAATVAVVVLAAAAACGARLANAAALDHFEPPVTAPGGLYASTWVKTSDVWNTPELCAQACLAWPQAPEAALQTGARSSNADSAPHSSSDGDAFARFGTGPPYAGDRAACVSFNWHPPSSPTKANTCSLSVYDPKYDQTVGGGDGTAIYVRRLPRDDTPLPPTYPVEYVLDTPRGNVTLGDGLLRDRFLTNIAYLLGHPVDDLLYYFRLRSGQTSPPGQCWGWDGGLRGSIAGLFMMGAGGTARWPDGVTNATLTKALDDVVTGIADCAGPDGYAMAFDRNETWAHENPDYVTAWVTHGLIEAHRAGNPEALSVARAHLNWFNNNTYLPQFMPPNDDPADPPPGRGGWGPAAEGHQIYLIYQGIIHTTRMAASELGTQQDLNIVENLYQEDWWLRELAALNQSAVWQRTWFPHNYELSAADAYADMYVLTGNTTYLDAMMGLWKLFRDHWIHVGGSMAINEAMFYPPGSYYLDYTDRGHNVAHTHRHNHDGEGAGVGDGGAPACAGPSDSIDGTRLGLHTHGPLKFDPSYDPEAGGHPTGELCGSSFWIKLNQRFHRLYPDNETFVAEIERSIINIALAAQPPLDYSGGLGIRYFALLHKNKQLPTNHGTCCEGQGTRIFGSLPEYVYSYSPKGLYVDMYAASAITFVPAGASSEVTVATAADFALYDAASGGNKVSVSVAPSGGATSSFELALRMPAWSSAGGSDNVTVTVTPPAAGGSPSTHVGHVGSYLKLSQTWSGAGPTVVSFTLPVGFRVTPYTGLTTVANHTRVAYEYGPTLLAVIGTGWDDTLQCTVMPQGLDPMRPQDWLAPAGSGLPLHFAVKGQTVAAYEYVPYLGIQDEIFSVYACFPQA